VQYSAALSALSPAAALGHIGLLGKEMNAGQSLQLNGSISATETSNLTALWSISYCSALSPLRNSVSASLGSHYLAIPPYSLLGWVVRYGL